MTKEQVTQELQKQTKENPVYNAVFHVLALRELPRYNLTPDGLYYRMRREGFKYSRKEYLPVFELLARLGLARLVKTPKGEVEQVKDFRLPLPQLGALACGQPVELDKMQKLLHAGFKPMAESEPNMTSRSLSGKDHVVVTQTLVSRKQPIRRAIVTQAGPAGQEPTTVPTREPRDPRPYQTPGSRLILTVLVNDKPINIPVPRDLTPVELANFLGRLMGEAGG